MRLHDYDPSSASYFIGIGHNHCDGIKVKKNRLFAHCTVFDALNKALQTANDYHQGMEDLRTCKVRLVTMVLKE